MCITAGMSSTTTVASWTDGDDPDVGIPGKHPRRDDLVPASSFPSFDKAGGSRRFSCLKKSSMSASGRACNDRKSLVINAVFAFADPSLFVLFF